MEWLNNIIVSILEILGVDLSSKMGQSINYFIFATLKIVVLLAVIVFVISYIQSYFPPERTKKILSRYKGIKANIIAAMLGILSPFCSCSSIPLFIGLNKAGVPYGATFSFLICSPLVDLASLIFLVSLFGLKIGIAYVVVGVVLAVVGGLIIQKFDLDSNIITSAKEESCCSKAETTVKKISKISKDNTIKITKKPQGSSIDLNKGIIKNTTILDNNASSSCCSKESVLKLENCCNKEEVTNCCSSNKTIESSSCCGNENKDSKDIDRIAYAKEQVISIIKDIWVYILISMVVGTVIKIWIPQDYILTFLGENNPFSVLIATAVGVPMYTDEMSAMIIGEALYSQGVQLGTILSFMMSAAALSLPSMIMLKKVLSTKLLGIFVAIVTIGIILVGYLFNIVGYIF